MPADFVFVSDRMAKGVCLKRNRVVVAACMHWGNARTGTVDNEQSKSVNEKKKGGKRERRNWERRGRRKGKQETMRPSRSLCEWCLMFVLELRLPVGAVVDVGLDVRGLVRVLPATQEQTKTETEERTMSETAAAVASQYPSGSDSMQPITAHAHVQLSRTSSKQLVSSAPLIFGTMDGLSFR